MSFEVHVATPDDRLGVRRVLDAAMLDVREDLPERIAADDVLVVRGGTDRVLGALVLVPCEDDTATPAASVHVDAVAVRRARRGQGVGSALVRTAAERHGRLTAEFDADVRPFYESLGFEIEAVEGEGERGGEGEDEADRFRGRYES